MNHGYLAKKSWHPLTIRNAEKVWLAEQRDISERKKMTELQKKLEDERKMMELHSVKDASGKYDKKKERVDFLYRGAPEVTADEFLEGKAYDFSKEESELLGEGEVQLGLLSNKPESSTQDMWAKIREDPLMEILKKKQDQVEKLRDNPIKMARLRQQLELEKKKKKHHKDKKDRSGKRSKEEKREKKRRREEKEERKRKRRDYDEDPDSPSSERRRKRQHSRKDEGSSPPPRRRRESPRTRTSDDEKEAKLPSPPPQKKSRWAPIGSRPDLERDQAELEESVRNFRKRPDSSSSTSSSRSYHHEDKEEIRKKMVQDARDHRESEERKHRQEIEREQKEKKGTLKGPEERPKFLNDTNRAIYLEHDESLGDVLHRRQHYRQRISRE